jgi:hypothetical protein
MIQHCGLSCPVRVADNVDWERDYSGWTQDRLLGMSDSQLSEVDPLAMNLIIAKGVPTLRGLNVWSYQETPNTWDKGIKITKEMIDGQLKEMIRKYKLRKLGFAAKFPYEMAKAAYEAAERAARRRHARETAEAAAKAARKIAGEVAEDAATGAARRGASKGRGAMRGLVKKVPVVGFVVGLLVEAAMAEDGEGPSFEPLGLGPTTLGYDDEIRFDPEAWDQSAIDGWMEYQEELNEAWRAQQGLLDGLDTLGTPFPSWDPPTPSSRPNRP